MKDLTDPADDRHVSITMKVGNNSINAAGPACLVWRLVHTFEVLTIQK